MDQSPGKSRWLTTILLGLYFIFFTALIFSLRAISSISIAAIFLTGLRTLRSSFSPAIGKKEVVFFIAGCISYFLLTVISMLYTENSIAGWNQVRLKTGLVVIPLAVFFTSVFIRQNKQPLLLQFTGILLVAVLFCLIMAITRYTHSGDTAEFFYHELVRPLKQHAVYFSVFILIALVYLLERTGKDDSSIPRPKRIILIIFFSFFLFLLSSRLVLIFYGLFILYFILRSVKKDPFRRSMAIMLGFLLVTATGIILLTNNPVRTRFSDMMKGTGISGKEKFDPGDYFNGIQLRLLEWKLVTEILSENKRWIAGMSAGDAQYWLDQKYISKNMYIGDKGRNDRGFLGYNTHNQFLQSLLQSGIIGAVVFSMTCLALLAIAWKKKNREFTAIILVLLVYAGLESLFETQYGIILFTFFPVFLFALGSRQTSFQTRKKAG